MIRYTYWLADRQTDWPTDWLTDWLTGWLAGWLSDWLTDWLTDWPGSFFTSKDFPCDLTRIWHELPVDIITVLTCLTPASLKCYSQFLDVAKNATNLTRNRRRHVEVSCKNGILKNLKKVSENHLCWIAKCLRAPILQNTFRTTASL